MAIVAMHTDWTSSFFLPFFGFPSKLSFCLPFFARTKAMVAEGTNPHPDLFGAIVLLAVNAKYPLDAIKEMAFGIRLTATGVPLSPSVVIPNDFRCKHDRCYGQDD